MMSQMRTILVKGGAGGVDSLFLGQTAKPKPSVGEVLVKVSVNLHQRLYFMRWINDDEGMAIRFRA